MRNRINETVVLVVYRCTLDTGHGPKWLPNGSNYNEMTSAKISKQLLTSARLWSTGRGQISPEVDAVALDD